MRPIVVDDFTPHVEQVRGYAEKLGFGPVEYQGHTFNGIGRGALHVAPRLQEILGFPVNIDLQFFRLGLSGDEQPTFIHCDNVGSDYACVFGLTRPEHCQGGTAFWRHRRTGLTGLYPWEDAPDIRAEVHADTHDESAWEMQHLAELRWNRAVIYPSAIFHSRYPQNAFGSSIEDGRLVWCAFFSEDRTNR